MSFQFLAKLAVTTRGTALTVAVAAAVLAFAAAVPAPALGQSSPGGDAWTRTLNVDLSARDLGLRAGATARRLARAALARKAGRLGLPRSLRGVRLATARHVPGGPQGARELDLLRFQQTVSGVRVLWSQIDVAVAAGRVSSISASVLPVTGRRVAGKRKVSRSRALRIALRAVSGPERALQPLPVALAGKPTTRRNPRARTARLAWVVETMPASKLGAETPIPLCIVVDARTGKVIGRWRGIADRPARGAQARGAPTASADRHGRLDAATARAAQANGDDLLTMFDGSGAAPDSDHPFDGADLYASFFVDGDPHRGPSWPPIPSTPPYNRACTQNREPLPCVNYFRTGSAVMDAAATNARNVAFTICAARDYCGSRGRRGETDYQAWLVIGNGSGSDSRAFPDTLAVELRAGSEMDGTPNCGPLGCPGGPQTPDPRQPFNDVIAHEFGHVRDWVSAGDRSSGEAQVDEVEEALADMFAYDYDRDDATAFEQTASGTARDWANPGAESLDGQPYPAHMDDYDSTPPGGKPHFNSTILSHAYYLFVEDVGHDVAGEVLKHVPPSLSPKPTFSEVAQMFHERAEDLYGGEVSGSAGAALGQVGLRPPRPEEPDCGPAPC